MDKKKDRKIIDINEKKKEAQPENDNLKKKLTEQIDEENDKKERRGRKTKQDKAEEEIAILNQNAIEVIAPIIETINIILPPTWKMIDEEKQQLILPLTKVIMKYFPSFFDTMGAEAQLIAWGAVYIGKRLLFNKKVDEEIKDNNIEEIENDKSDSGKKGHGKNDLSEKDNKPKPE
jgi:hypothetical protein